jgi:hypothetical protein
MATNPGWVVPGMSVYDTTNGFLNHVSSQQRGFYARVPAQRELDSSQTSTSGQATGDQVIVRAMIRRWRCLDGDPKVSTMIRLAAISRSIALAKASDVVPSAPGIVANSFGA